MLGVRVDVIISGARRAEYCVPIYPIRTTKSVGNREPNRDAGWGCRPGATRGPARVARALHPAGTHAREKRCVESRLNRSANPLDRRSRPRTRLATTSDKTFKNA